VCVPALAIGDTCEEDVECGTGYCARGPYGEGPRCTKKAGEPCTDRSECEQSCAMPATGGPGYCLDQCNRYCGNGCYSACEDRSYVCGSDMTCRKGCTEDGDCRDWELCEFESAVDTQGTCRTKPGTGSIAGAGG